MPTYTLTGSGTQAITSPGSLKVVVTVRPAWVGSGTAYPPNFYGLGLLRVGTVHGYLPPVPVHADAQLIPCPNGATILGYSLETGVEITVEERAEQPYAGPTGPPGATGATGSSGSPIFLGARVYNSANISITSGSDQALTFNSERFDTNTIHSTSTNTGRLTCVTAGYYQIWANVLWSAHATGERDVFFRLNGSTRLGQVNQRVPTSAAVAQQCSALALLAVGDYVECMVYQDSGSTLTILNSANYSPEFGMYLIGPP